MTTRVSGSSARISRQASMPDPSGSRTSITTMSGWWRLRLLDRLRDGPGLGDDLEALAPVEQRDEALPDDLVIVDDEQPERSWAGWSDRSCGWLLGLVWCGGRHANP